MQTRKVTPPVLAATLASLVNWPSVRGLKGIQLQAPAANGAPILYGGHDAQLFELAAGSTTDVLPIPHLNDLKVSGDGADTLLVMAFA